MPYQIFEPYNLHQHYVWKKKKILNIFEKSEINEKINAAHQGCIN